MDKKWGNRKLDTPEDDLEFRRKLWLQRVSTYSSIAELAGKIAAHEKKDAEFDELTESFLGAYWGLMILVEDKAVENAMIKFGDEIRDYRKGQSDANRIKGRADSANISNTWRD